MAQFNPDFWEVTLEAAAWEGFSTEDALWRETAEPTTGLVAGRARELWPRIQELMAEVLTERQLAVVRLHFLEGLNQRDIAARLGITQQAVSEHLYGKVRNGRTVGGALRKLRKACAKAGLAWDG